MIKLKDGSGGASSHDLTKEIFLPFFSELMQFSNEDGGIFESDKKCATSTDSYIISPYFFSGGDIGKLSICGSCNDVVMMGAKPRYINIGFIIEEGFSKKDLKIIVRSIYEECKRANLAILSCDTKVLPRFSNMPNIFINTTCIGEIMLENISSLNVHENDNIILSSKIGAHGASIFLAQNNMGLSSDIKSDCANLYFMLEEIFKNKIELHALRDATRGGIASALNEWAMSSNITIEINESEIMIDKNVQGVCEMLGLDFYELANEGVCVIAVSEKYTKNVLDLLHKVETGINARVIGRAFKSQNDRKVILKTKYDTARFLEYPQGEILPRIC